jgi:hypothetical protein
MTGQVHCQSRSSVFEILILMLVRTNMRAHTGDTLQVLVQSLAGVIAVRSKENSNFRVTFTRVEHAKIKKYVHKSINVISYVFVVGTEKKILLHHIVIVHFFSNFQIKKGTEK